ncbi:MAG: hypothetical protein KA436_05090 [Oligoflexales bacterium]|nr:hypothetical protein [Oligoflexales bacterium]
MNLLLPLICLLVFTVVDCRTSKKYKPIKRATDVTDYHPIEKDSELVDDKEKKAQIEIYLQEQEQAQQRRKQSLSDRKEQEKNLEEEIHHADDRLKSKQAELDKKKQKLERAEDKLKETPWIEEPAIPTSPAGPSVTLPPAANPLPPTDQTVISNRPPKEWAAELAPIVARYLIDVKRLKMVDLTEVTKHLGKVELVDTLSHAGAVGICERYYPGPTLNIKMLKQPPPITIHTPFGVQMVNGVWDQGAMRAIMYHELTHCLLNKDHLPTTSENQTELMYPQAPLEPKNIASLSSLLSALSPFPPTTSLTFSTKFSEDQWEAKLFNLLVGKFDLCPNLLGGNL